MTIQEFVEDAVEGGWSHQPTLMMANEPHPIALECIFLDPAAWQAVGRVRGWDGPDTPKPFGDSTSHTKAKMTHLMTALYSGKSVEDYLSSLTKKDEI